MQITLELIIILTAVLLIGLNVKIVPKTPKFLLLISLSSSIVLIFIIFISKSGECYHNTNKESKGKKLELENKKVKINTDRNQEVHIETGRINIDYQDESLKELQDISKIDYPMHSFDQKNTKDCTVDLSCIIKSDQETLQKSYNELEGHSKYLNNPEYKENQKYQGYMTEAQIDGYAPSGLKYCPDLTCQENFEAPLFYNVPPESTKLDNQMCRHCKVGFCLGGVCGSEILKNPDNMPNYFHK